LSCSLVAACAVPEVQSQKLNDGSWAFTCELPMDECLRQAQKTCKNQRYRILDGTSETRLRDVPPFEEAYHTSRVHLVCTNDGAAPLLSFQSPPADPKAARACTPGETRECVGPAACRGGQACVADGSAFGPCQCGSVAPVPAAAPAAAPAPASDVAPAQSVPPTTAPSSVGPAAPAP
jgi:hypothetical protein